MKPIHSDQTQFAALTSKLDSVQNRNAKLGERQTQVSQLLRSAAADLKANRLSTSASGNALDRYSRVLQIDPNNEVATAGLKKIGERYISLARSAIRNQKFDGAREHLARATRLDIPSATISQLSAELAAAQAQANKDNMARTLAQERERLAREANEILEAAKDAAAREKRRRQEAEAKRLFEIEQAKQKSRVTSKRSADELRQRSTLVIEFDGVGGQTEIYGLMQNEVRADMESRLRALGYNVVLHHEANRSPLTRLFIVRFRANLNSASGVFSYDEYNQIMRLFSQQVGQAPGRL